MLEWILRYEIWLIAALMLIAVDVFLGLDFILLAFGVGAAMTALSLLLSETLPLPYTQDWQGLLTFFGILSLVILVPLRRLTQKSLGDSDDTDINRY